MRERLIKLQEDLKRTIQDFEQETGLLVNPNININRGGCTDGSPYMIYGVYVAVTPNSAWKPK